MSSLPADSVAPASCIVMRHAGNREMYTSSRFSPPVPGSWQSRCVRLAQMRYALCRLECDRAPETTAPGCSYSSRSICRHKCFPTIGTRADRVAATMHLDSPFSGLLLRRVAHPCIEKETMSVFAPTSYPQQQPCMSPSQPVKVELKSFRVPIALYLA
ncbi:hypothetical protein MRB53_038952 [Persea americana]|nr:hypothetical protein MRB53_038952 [Persea americana]